MTEDVVDCEQHVDYFGALEICVTHIWPWSTKAVLSRWGIFVAIANNTLYGSKLSIFILCQKSLGY